MRTSGVEPVANLVLDTSAYSWLRRGHATTLDWIAAADLVAVPATVLGELEAGFRLGSRVAENRAMLAAFLDEPFVVVLPTTPRVARCYGTLMADLRRAGTPIPVNDVWIAAAVTESGGHLLTFDQHFAKVGGIARTILDG